MKKLKISPNFFIYKFLLNRRLDHNYFVLLPLQNWRDEFMVWNPEDYGNITNMKIASELVWMPDVVLYNKWVYMVAIILSLIITLIPQSHLLYGGRIYGGRRTPKSSDSCGCRRNSAVAAGPPYGESLCFTGRRGGRRIIARSYNFFFISTFAVEIWHAVAMP